MNVLRGHTVVHVAPTGDGLLDPYLESRDVEKATPPTVEGVLVQLDIGDARGFVGAIDDHLVHTLQQSAGVYVVGSDVRAVRQLTAALKRAAVMEAMAGD